MFVSAKELREKSIEQLQNELPKLEAEYMNLRQQKHSKTAEREYVREAKKNVTRCKAVLREKKLLVLIEEHKNSVLPKQLRPRFTKAMRMELSEKQANKVTKKQRIARMKYPQQIFSFNAN